MTEHADATPRMLRDYAVAFVVLTMALGVAMRWDLANGWLAAAGVGFENVRHGHSHAGYYGALTLAWWLVVHRAGLAPGLRTVHAYAVFAGTASVLFAFMGYRAWTIALSTVVASFWIHAGWRHVRARLPPRWTDSAPWGLAMGTLLVPVIAVLSRRDFQLGREVAHLFIAILSFTIFVPAAWEAIGVVRRQPTWLHVVLATGTAAAVVFPEQLGPVSVVFPLVFASWCVLVISGAALSSFTRWTWWAFAAGTAVSGVVPALHGYAFRIASIHLLVLGPVVMSLSHVVLPRLPRPPWVVAYVALLLVMTGALLGQGVTGPHGTTVTAVASTLLALVAAGAAWSTWPRGDQPS